MSSTNLLPRQCMDQRRRTRRRTVWCVVCAAVFVGLGISYAWASIADDTHLRLTSALASTHSRLADAERQLTLVSRERNGFLDSARRLYALHTTVRLPERLQALVSAMPRGLYLTDLRAAPVQNAATPALAPARSASTRPAAPPAGPPPAITRYELHGFAADHETLRGFIAALEKLDTFEKVELIQATREKRGGVDAVRFRVDCRQVEEGA